MANYVIVAAEVAHLGGVAFQKGICGAATGIVAGEAVACDPVTSKIVLADADINDTTPLCGIAVSSAALNQPIHYSPNGANVRLKSGGSLDGTGEPVFLSQTAGKMIPHNDLNVGFTGKPVLVGFLYPAAVRENIKISFAWGDETYLD